MNVADAVGAVSTAIRVEAILRINFRHVAHRDHGVHARLRRIRKLARGRLRPARTQIGRDRCEAAAINSLSPRVFCNLPGMPRHQLTDHEPIEFRVTQPPEAEGGGGIKKNASNQSVKGVANESVRKCGSACVWLEQTREAPRRRLRDFDQPVRFQV